LLQRNAVSSWLHLGPDVEVLLIGDEEGMAETAAQMGVRHLPQVERNENGTPRLDSVFRLAQEHGRGALLCYANADILFLDDFLPAVQRASERFERFLIVGRRWDLKVEGGLDFGGGSSSRLRERLGESGRLHPPRGSDYFVFPRGTFVDIPPFALGRSGWDNWMIYRGRSLGIPVIDASGVITVVHQAHDYSHLPGGVRHHRLPESKENVRLAGGREVMFTLADADWRLGPEGVVPKRWSLSMSPRRLEAGLIVHLGPGKAARSVRMLMHPLDTARYYLGAAWRRITGSEARGERAKTPS
jgi:hypothetical protein